MTQKQRLWIDFFKQGKTASEAARLAGYSAEKCDLYGMRNLSLLKDIGKNGLPRIADISEIRAFWTSVMRSPEEKTADRLRASEMCVKTSESTCEECLDMADWALLRRVSRRLDE